ncbi:MAG: NAD(P)H-binding protein [Terracidiphilus sp.]
MNVVTGAFGYTGKYIARRLINSGEKVITLTGSPNRANEFGNKVKAFPFNFENPDAMASSITGAHTLYNTYWVRFDRRDETHDRAVRNTIALIKAAKMAGVRRIVHISITNPSLDSGLPYFRGKALLEEEIRQSQISYAILRPTVIFGNEDILINNIAFLLRKLPAFIVPGDGRYSLQPIFVEDLAQIAVEASQRAENLTIDAVGPETFQFEQLVRLIAKSLDSRARLLNGPPWLALLASRVMGLALADVMLTRYELKGLMANLLISDSAATGQTQLSDWLTANSATLGKRYASEIGRHYTSN